MDETEKLGRDWVGLAEGSREQAKNMSVCFRDFVCLFVCLLLSRKKCRKGSHFDPLQLLLLVLNSSPKAQDDQLTC